MKKLIIIALALSLGACAQLQKLETAYEVVTEATVTPKQIYIAANTFDGVQATATNYLNYCRPRLTEEVCSADNRRIVIKAVRSGRAARNQLETYLDKNNPAPSTIYNVLIAAITTLNSSAATKVNVQ